MLLHPRAYFFKKKTIKQKKNSITHDSLQNTNKHTKQTNKKTITHYLFTFLYAHTDLQHSTHVLARYNTSTYTPISHIHLPTHYQYLYTFNKYKLCYVQDFFQHLSTKCVPFQQLTLASKSSLHA